MPFWLFLALWAHLEHGLNFFMSYQNMEFTIPYAFQGKIFVVFWHICYLLSYWLLFAIWLLFATFWLFLALLAHLENGPNFFMSYRNMEFTIERYEIVKIVPENVSEKSHRGIVHESTEI